MKKVWALEKKVTEVDIANMKEVYNSIVSPEIPEEALQKLKDHVDSLKVGDWQKDIATNNYYKFCKAVKDKLRKADAKAIHEFKAELGKVSFSSDINDKFRETHQNVFASFRVVEGEVDDLEVNFYNYKFVKENEGVYKYLWSTK